MYSDDTNPALVGITNKDGDIIGSGCWILNYGQILTCYHLVEDREDIIIVNSKQERLPAKIKHTFPEPIWNMAILETGHRPEHYLIPGTDYELKDDIRILALDGTSTMSTIINNVAIYGEKVPALSLREPAINENTHNAPVILRRNNKLIGIMNRKIPFILFIPFSAMLKRLPGFAPIFDRWIQNSHFISSLKPLDMLHRIALSDIDKLKINQDYSDQYFVNRGHIASAISRFTRNNHHLQAITGKQGMGKTYQLAAFADDNKDALNIIWLSIDVLDIRIRDIRAEIINKLSTDLKESDELALFAEDLLYAMVRVPYSTTIIIDGLDYLCGSDDEINKWLVHTLNWIKKLNQKILISCSPECWQVHQDLITNTLDTQYHVIELRPFTQPELKQALTNYGLPAAYSTDGRCRHPFVLHVLSCLPELLNDEPLENFNLYKLLSAYFEKKVLALKADTNRNTDSMHWFLDEMGRYSYDTGNNFLPIDNIKRTNKQIIPLFIKYHILVRTIEGVRFKQKWLAAFIMSFSNRFEMVKCDWDWLYNANENVKQCAPWCFIRRLQHGHGILPQMEQLADYIIQHPNHNKQAIEYFITIIIFSTKPRWYFSCIKKAAAAGVLSEKNITTLLEGAYFKFPQQMELVKYMYIRKATSTMDPEIIDPMLLRCLTENRKYSLKLIAAWLPDHTTNLHNIACTILRRYAADNLEFVMELLAEYIDKVDPASLHEDHTLSALGEIICASFNPSLEILENWETRRKHIHVIIKTADYLISLISLDKEKKLLLVTLMGTILKSYRLSPEELLQCLRVLKTSMEYEEVIISHALEQLQDEAFIGNIYEFLHPHTDKYHHLITNPILQYILHGENENRVQECYKLFPFKNKMLIEQHYLLQSLHASWISYSNQQKRIFTLLPFLLQVSDHGTKTYGILKDWLVDGIFNYHLGVSQEIIDYICNRTNCPGKRKDNLRLIHLLCKKTDDTALHQKICFKLIDNDIYISEERILDTIKPALNKSIKENNELLNVVLSTCKSGRPFLYHLIHTQFISSKIEQ